MYDDLSDSDYYRLTQFDRSSSKPINCDEVMKKETHLGELIVDRIEISKGLFFKINEYVEASGLRTRYPSPVSSEDDDLPYSFTVYTVNFSLHAIKGRRGGWFVMDREGGEPIINNEFIAYGAKRKSGGRKHSYRRKLSESEKRQVEWLRTRTPTIEQMYKWISKKYMPDILKISLYFKDDPNAFPF